MAAEGQQLDCYVFYVPYGPLATREAASVAPGAKVRDLREAIKKECYGLEALRNERPILLKCGELLTVGNLFDNAAAWLRRHASSIMHPVDRIEKYFPDGPYAGDEDIIDVIVVTDSILESRDVVSYDLPLIEMSVKKASNASGIRSTSETIKDPKEIRNCVERSDLYLHRPALNYGPHTSLFNHAFARLKHRLEHLDDPTTWVPEMEPGSELLASCHSFITGSCRVYDGEDQRDIVLKSFFLELLKVDGSYKKSLQDNSAKPDATRGYPFRIICEDKNEDGAGGNSSLQGMISYRKAIAQELYKPYIERSNCPAIIIGIMGNRMEISTAVFIGGVYADKLISQELYLDAFQAKSILRLGRIAVALRACYEELNDHYKSIDTKAEPTITHLYPGPLPALGYSKTPALKYMGRLSHGGQCIPVIQKERGEEIGESERRYAIYRAKMADSDGEVDVVVKFTAQYNDTAHKILERAQLAPRLRYFARLVSGHYMVVMDYVDSLPLSDAPKQENYLDIFHRVRKAIGLLHEENLVFGDLRPQNVVLNSKKEAMLIDFDFTGRHGVDRYPASWDTTKHHPDVRRHGIMDKGHDSFMLSELRKILEEYNNA